MKKFIIANLVFTFLLTFQLLAENQQGYKGYVEYIPGDIPLIISAPHGGRLSPKEIPDRKYGTTVTDTNTDKLAKQIAADFKQSYGKSPHVIICHLKRVKVDCNRDIKEGAQGNEDAEKTWESFHSFIKKAQDSILKTKKRGFYVDLHAHGHKFQRIELGYLISGKNLKLSDEKLNKLIKESSLNPLCQYNGYELSGILRGKSSFGAFLEKYKFPSVPSPKYKDSGSHKYFSGGYNTRRYCKGSFSGFQVECNKKGVRDTEESRKLFASAFNKSIIEYLKLHLKEDLKK